VASNLLPTVSRILCIDLCILLELTKRYLKGPKGVVTEDPWISTGGLSFEATLVNAFENDKDWGDSWMYAAWVS
jgi:hypothetical protein